MRWKTFADRFTASNTNLLEDGSFPPFLRWPVGRDFPGVHGGPFDGRGARPRQSVIRMQPAFRLLWLRKSAAARPRAVPTPGLPPSVQLIGKRRWGTGCSGLVPFLQRSQELPPSF